MTDNSQAILPGIICYYSGSGNTRLACQYIQDTIKNVKFDLFNITRGSLPDLSVYDVAGFATFTDFLDPPHLFLSFIERLPAQDNKPAFVFNTFGFINGKTCYTLGKRVSTKGFNVIAGHSLHMPESYPPMIAGGHGNTQAPDDKELNEFKNFVSHMEDACGLLRAGCHTEIGKAGFNFISRILPPLSRQRSRNDMGLKYVDADLCDECGICGKICPYSAIKLDPRPVFDMAKCYGCWSCYNHCPKKAIYTRKFRGIGHYPKPIDSLKEKLKA
jgi:ferredoxin